MPAQRDRLYADVQFLTSRSPARNHRNLGVLSEVCDWLKREFETMGAQPEMQTWTADGNEYQNIIASYNSAAKKRLVVGAHYDVCGDQPGADDNASAVAGLLETARLLFEEKPTLDYRIDFVAYCLEEPPYFATKSMGSYVHARSLKTEGAEVTGMICYEMIGYFSEEPGSQKYPDPALAARFPDRGNFITVVGIADYEAFNNRFHALMRERAAIDVQVISFADEAGRGYAGLSDQRNYWAMGYPALMINDTSFLRNPHYHQATDTIDTLDFDKMTEVVNGVYGAVVRME